MTLLRVIQMARTLTQREGAVVDRQRFITAMEEAGAYRVDVTAEQNIANFKKDPSRILRLTSVDACIVRPTLDYLGIKYIDEVAIPKTLGLYNKFYGELNTFSAVPQVIYGSWLDACEKRFVFAKECLHLYTNTASGVTTAEELIDSARRSYRNIPSSPDTILDDEATALFLAIETLLPWQLRDHRTSDDLYTWLQTDKKATPAQIARVFMVPVELINLFQSQIPHSESTYAGLSQDINSRI